MRRSILIFAVLQAADIVTTLLGFQLGAGEASPFVRFLVGSSPLTGLLAAKTVAAFLAAAVLLSGRTLRRVNLWFSAVVVWNLGVIACSLS